MAGTHLYGIDLVEELKTPPDIGNTTPAAGSFSQISPTINVETLAAARTLLVTDYICQWLDPNGVTRDVIFPPEASSTNLMFILLNDGSQATFNLVCKNDAAVTVATLGPGMSGIFSCDGTNWKWEDETGVYYDAISGNIEIKGLLSQIGLGYSTYLGFEAGKVDDLTDNGNTGIGYQALIANTTGYYNTAMGYQALIANTTGYYNTAMGYQALSTNIIGIQNIAIGHFAGRYELGSNAFYVNNQDRVNTATEKLRSIIYGQMAFDVSNQKLTFNADVKIAGIVKTPKTQTLTGAGAVDIVSAMTLIATTAADALTLADGAVGQEKFLVMTSDGGAGTLTPTNLLNGTTITFDDVGDSAHLKFMLTGWVWIGGTATLA